MDRHELNRVFDQLVPTAGQEEALLNRLLEPERKDKPMKRLKKLTVFGIAAALMVVTCAAAVASGLPARLYQLATGGWHRSSSAGGYLYATKDNPPVELRGGRLWFTADGQELDITGLVDENTPYIYTRTDPGSGTTGYIIVGGTPENFGWAEFGADTKGAEFGVTENAGTDYYVSNREWFAVDEVTEELWYERIVPQGYGFVTVYYPWYKEAKAQLDLHIM